MHSLLKDSSEPPSSAHQVISNCNDDLLTEILLRLPPFSLRLVKYVYVCKRWSTLITNPNFTLRRSQNPMPDLPSGLIIQRKNSYECDFVPLNYRLRASNFNFDVKSRNNNKVEILQSCNGLLLCRDIMSDELCVYNTLIHRFHSIDNSPLGVGQSFYSPSCGLRMAFDCSKSPYGHYKIIYAREINSDEHGSLVQLHVYSSVTRSWNVVGARSFSLKGFKNGIYWNDGIHWIDGVNMLKLDVEHLTLTKIETPVKTYNGRLFESEGCLLLICIELVVYKDQWLNIYQMNKSHSRWSRRGFVNLDGVTTKFPQTLRESREWFISSVRCIVKDKKNDNYIDFLVMELYGKMMHYPIWSMEIRKLYELASDNSSVSFVYMAPFSSIL